MKYFSVIFIFGISGIFASNDEIREKRQYSTDYYTTTPEPYSSSSLAYSSSSPRYTTGTPYYEGWHTTPQPYTTGTPYATPASYMGPSILNMQMNMMMIMLMNNMMLYTVMMRQRPNYLPNRLKPMFGRRGLGQGRGRVWGRARPQGWARGRNGRRFSG